MKSKSESKENLIESGVSFEATTSEHPVNLNDPVERPLGPVEKTFLLHAERGDCATVRK